MTIIVVRTASPTLKSSGSTHMSLMRISLPLVLICVSSCGSSDRSESFGRTSSALSIYMSDTLVTTPAAYNPSNQEVSSIYVPGSSGGYALGFNNGGSWTAGSPCTTSNNSNFNGWAYRDSGGAFHFSAMNSNNFGGWGSPPSAEIGNRNWCSYGGDPWLAATGTSNHVFYSSIGSNEITTYVTVALSTNGGQTYGHP